MKESLGRHLQPLFSNMELGDDGIWSSALPVSEQEVEQRLREGVAEKECDNYLSEIAMHHSIPVMDYEVTKFLDTLPHGAVVLDVGGCWGWHWRKLSNQRPDVSVVIIDFVRSNLRHAQQVLGSLVGTQIALVHADATLFLFLTAGSMVAGLYKPFNTFLILQRLAMRLIGC